MNIGELKNLAESLLETFINAGYKAMELRNNGLKITFKSDNTPVTNGDLEIDKLLKEKIIQSTPSIPLISEETVKLNNNKLFSTNEFRF